MLIPIGVDVPFDRRPLLNWLVILGCVAVFVLEILVISADGPEAINGYLLNGFNFTGLFSHMWLHAGLLHLIGNMLFLWVFGNAVCSKLGNFIYLPV